MKKLTYIILLALITPIGLLAQYDEPCLPEGITFTTQAQIDSFPINYPDCSEIQGNLRIAGDDITNLNGLSSLTTIGGFLQFPDNPVLNSLSGLDNLDTIRGYLIFGGHPQAASGNPALSNMTGLEGLKHIAGLDISNNDGLESLSGLEGLTSTGSTYIAYNDSLISLAGLNNVDTFMGLSIYDNDALINLAGLDNLVSILGSMSIMGNDNMTSLTGLENLKNIVEDVAIGGPNAYEGNNALLNLNGLNNLDSIGGLFSIANNSLLSSLTGLDSLTYLGGDLRIHYNQALASLTGLDNLNAGSINNLFITENFSLEACAVQSVCNYLANPNGAVTIHSNATGCNNPPEIANACGINLPCLPYGNYYFFTQNEISDFQLNYPECYELQGYVMIIGNDIHDLEELSLISYIGEYLWIDNTSLPNLNGLVNLSTIGSSLVIESNNSLTSIATLSNLNSITGSIRIRGNNSLTSLTGLNNVTSITGQLTIYNNASLESLSELGNLTFLGSLVVWNNALLLNLEGFINLDSINNRLEVNGNNALLNLSGLDNVISIGTNLKISNNPALTSLIELENLTTIGSLDISGNPLLESLTGLENIDGDSIIRLRIFDNGSLSMCEVESICNYLSDPNLFGDVIENNAPGCNSIEEIEVACETVNINEVMILEKPIIYPNPLSTSATFKFETTQTEKIEINIYNQLGELIEDIQMNAQPGKQTIQWDAIGLPAGIYFCVLKTESGTQTMKMIKLK